MYLYKFTEPENIRVLEETAINSPTVLMLSEENLENMVRIQSKFRNDLLFFRTITLAKISSPLSRALLRFNTETKRFNSIIWEASFDIALANEVANRALELISAHGFSDPKIIDAVYAVGDVTIYGLANKKKLEEYNTYIFDIILAQQNINIFVSKELYAISGAIRAAISMLDRNYNLVATFASLTCAAEISKVKFVEDRISSGHSVNNTGVNDPMSTDFFNGMSASEYNLEQSVSAITNLHDRCLQLAGWDEPT
jgi:hypothetical protein